MKGGQQEVVKHQGLASMENHSYPWAQWEGTDTWRRLLDGSLAPQERNPAAASSQSPSETDRGINIPATSLLLLTPC